MTIIHTDRLTHIHKINACISPLVDMLLHSTLPENTLTTEWTVAGAAVLAGRCAQIPDSGAEQEKQHKFTGALLNNFRCFAPEIYVSPTKFPHISACDLSLRLYSFPGLVWIMNFNTYVKLVWYSRWIFAYSHIKQKMQKNNCYITGDWWYTQCDFRFDLFFSFSFSFSFPVIS